MHSTSTVIRQFASLRRQGHSLDEALQVLRGDGAGPMDYVRESDESLIAELEAMGLKDENK